MFLRIIVVSAVRWELEFCDEQMNLRSGSQCINAMWLCYDCWICNWTI